MVTRTADFVDTLGVNTHINYTDGHYSQVNKVLSSLDYLGINNLRDAAPLSGGQGQGNLSKVAQAGYKFDFIMWHSLGEQRAFTDLDSFLTRNPGSVIALEGPNEVDNYKVSFNNLTGVAAAVQIQQSIYNRVHSSVRYEGIDVYNLTNSTSVAAPADYANIHSYSKNGDQAIGWLTRDMDRQVSTQSSLPRVLTEAGYADVKTTSGWEGVDQPTQAKLTLNLLMDSSRLGISNVYLYELLDAYADPSGASVGKHLGLFDYDFKPKMVATAIHNLTGILADTSGTAQNFATTQLNYSTTGMASSAHTMVMQKSNGVHEIVLWDTPDIWDENKDVAIKAVDQTVKLDFHGDNKSIKIYDPLVSDRPIATYADVTSATVTISDHPVIIEVQDITPTSRLTSYLDSNSLGSAPRIMNGANTSASTYGSAQGEWMYGNGGDDNIYGRGGADRLYGGAGNDMIKAGKGAALLSGDAGDDVLYGFGGGQYYSGGDGNDRIYGDKTSGNDIYDGGAGSDSYFARGTDNLFYIRGDNYPVTSKDCDQIIDWHVSNKIDFGVSCTADTFYSGSANNFAEALTMANALFDSTTKQVAAYKIGSQLAVFGDTDAGHAGADVGLLIRGLNYSALDCTNFI